MPCDAYKHALSEAATGAPASIALRSHLESCADCRAALAEEQALYSSIDAGLGIVANAEVPPSLIPSVRARLNEHPAAARRWFGPVLAPLAAALILGILVVRALRPPVKSPFSPTMTVSTARPPSQPPPSFATPPSPRAAISEVPSASRPSTHPLHQRLDSLAETAPEVLVPRDQEILLASYAQQWQTHKYVRVTAELIPAPSLEPREVAPIQIAPLDVKALEEADSR